MEPQIIIAVLAVLLIIALLSFCYIPKKSTKKLQNGSLENFIAKLKEKSLAIMVYETNRSPNKQDIAESINKYIAKNFIDAIKEIVSQKIGRLSAQKLSITHISVNNEGIPKLPLSVDVVVIINLESNGTTNKLNLIFRYFKRVAGSMQEITIAEPTKIPLSGTAKHDLEEIDFEKELIEGFPGFKDAVTGKRISLARHNRKRNKK